MSTESKKKLAIVAITDNGIHLARKLKKNYEEATLYTSQKREQEDFRTIKGDLSAFCGYLFYKYEKVIFIMATGIVVRCIAPYIRDKMKDPAVLVVDELGMNVISLLSGHMGGANDFTRDVASKIEANPVITTATDINKKTNLEKILKVLNLNPENYRNEILKINSMLVNNKKVAVVCDLEAELDLRGMYIKKEGESFDYMDAVIYIGTKDRPFIEYNEIIKLTPKNMVVSIGCRKGYSKDMLKDRLYEFLIKNNLNINSISKIATVDVKKEERGIIELAKEINAELQIIDREDILKVENNFEKSEFVKMSIGVYSVAEPVAHISSGGNLVIKKHKLDGATFAAGRLKI